jgi:hypothetical protein
VPAGEGDEAFDVVGDVAVEDFVAVLVEVGVDRGDELGELPLGGVDVVRQFGVGGFVVARESALGGDDFGAEAVDG